MECARTLNSAIPLEAAPKTHALLYFFHLTEVRRPEGAIEWIDRDGVLFAQDNGRIIKGKKKKKKVYGEREGTSRANSNGNITHHKIPTQDGEIEGLNNNIYCSDA